MSHKSDLIAKDINAYLEQHERKELLRFLTCGSVDDGKSTLIGRLLYDSKMIYEDQLAAIQRDSTTQGNADGEFDPALLTDGLKAEREQGITIDVAYRYFSTDRRKFIIADTPGHEQYTRNMATGASTADLAIILVDARKGILTQTRRHSFIVSLLGIQHVMVAINKMDLVDYSQDVYQQIVRDYQEFATRLDVKDLHFIPISALKGDNVVEKSEAMAWHQGPTLMRFLETVYIAADRNLQDFRFPVQWVNRPNLDFRGYAGTIASGIVRQGDEVVALPSGKRSKVKEIVFQGEEDVQEAFAPQAVTLTLEDEIDISRGDMLVRPGNVPQVAEKFDASIVWMSDEPMVPGKDYIIKHGTKSVTGTISTLRYRTNVNTLHRENTPTLGLNEIGRCALRLKAPIAFDGYKRNRRTGAFIVIDRLSNATVGAGMISQVDTAEASGEQAWEQAPVSPNLDAKASAVTQEERQARFGQKPGTIFLTGLTGAGKTTIGYALERKLFDEGRAVTVVDGTNLRLGLSKDLGFTEHDRSETVRRGVETARMFNGAGVMAILGFIAPSEEVRESARALVGKQQFLMVHLDAPLEVCRERDEAGLYQRAEAGELPAFPGVTVEYEKPENPDIVLNTAETSVEACVETIFKALKERGWID